MLVASRAGDSHAEVREIIESGLAKLQDWLDLRLQQQEDILRGLSHSRGSASVRGLAVEDGSCSNSKVVALAGDITVSDVTEIETSQENGLENDPLCTKSAPIVKPYNCFLPGSTADVQEQGNAVNQFGAQFQKKNHSQLEVVPEWGSRTDAKKDQEVRGRRRSSINKIEDIDWQAKLMEVFDQLDLDKSGCIDHYEFLEAFKEVDMPAVQATSVFALMDTTGNGLIDRIEWLHLIESAAREDSGQASSLTELTEFLDRLANRQFDNGRIYATNRSRKPCLILRHDSRWRMSWDLLLMALLFYISVSMPYSLGFGQSKILDVIDRVCDFFFCVDVVLNFRTSYTDQDDAVIVNGKQIALKYLKSWFLLDFVSSIPFDLVTAGLLPNLTPARLLKIGKIAKIMKLLRISKMLTILAESEIMQKLEERSTSRAHQTGVRIVKLVLMAFLVAHWLACFGTAVDRSSLDFYFANEPQEPTAFQLYLAAIYWAMTTLSTVGYGDITPKTDPERAYAMIAMVIGGSLYGYVIGSVTSIVTDIDLNARAFHERMELIQSWLDRHTEIPKFFRRRLRKHFKRSLAAKLAMDDSAVVNELSPELRAETAFFLIHERVRQHPMFLNIANSALAKLVEVLQKSHTNASEFIVKAGDPGIAMYILVEGAARYKEGAKWHPPDTEAPGNRYQHVVGGDSFGEEIIFGLAETYTYTIVTVTECEVHSISEDGFRDRYHNMPELREQMYNAFLNSMGYCDDNGMPRVSLGDAQRKQYAPSFKAHRLSRGASVGLGQNPFRQQGQMRVHMKPF